MSHLAAVFGCASWHVPCDPSRTIPVVQRRCRSGQCHGCYRNTQYGHMLVGVHPPQASSMAEQITK